MLLVGNGLVLTLGHENRVIPDGAVLVEDSKIREVARTDDLRSR